ncbi:MAG: hypothetical protein KAG20_09600 [Cocleimonas sp.]|nr:hypothetical protein [Cocleimonas sp.]
MENALSIIAVLGGLLFVFSFVKYVLTGFRYHPVTGLLALIPVINVITLPTLMDGKIIRVILLGILGLMFSIGAWFLGADKSLYRHISILRGQSTFISGTQSGNQESQAMTSNMGVTSSGQPSSANVAPSSNNQPAVPQPVYFVNLPKHALYNMTFIDAPVDKISTLQGRTVQIITLKNTVAEGRLEKATTSSVFVLQKKNETVANEILISNIKQLKVLITSN